MPNQDVLTKNGVGLNALTITIDEFMNYIPEGFRLLRDSEKVHKDDRIANICGKVSWFPPDKDEIDKPAGKIGKFIIRKRKTV